MLTECRLQQVEKQTLHLHHYLDDTDECYFIGEYTSGQNYAYSEINRLISNLKKYPSKQLSNPMEYKYKLLAIDDVSNCLRRLINPEYWNSHITVVPIPPSKTKNHPEYDDRMSRVCAGAVKGFETPDFIELVHCKVDTEPTHNQDHKPTPDELITKYEIANIPSYHPRKYVFLVDDMLTTGTHFKACKKLILQAYPSVQVVGVFVSRRVFAPGS